LLELWLGRLSPSCRKALKSMVLGFLRWVRARGEFNSLGEMLEFQRGTVGDDRYRIVDLLVDHVQEKGGTYKGMVDQYGMVRSFFLHHRAELPRVPVRFRPTSDQAVGRLERVEDVGSMLWVEGSGHILDVVSGLDGSDEVYGV
jgi:hypothetical protein